MNEEFLSKGLEKNRYLKAGQLIEEFERQIELLLRSTGDRIVDECPEIFPDPSPKKSFGHGSGDTVSYQRFDFAMSGVTTLEEQTPKLNVHLYWVHPSVYNRTDIDGIVRGFGYKVKHSGDVDDLIAERTKVGDWNLNVATDPFGSRNVFYQHIDTGQDCKDVADELVSHFTEFADQWAQIGSTD